MKIVKMPRLMIVVSLLIALSLPSAAFARRGESGNPPHNYLFAIGGALAGAAIAYLGDGGVGLGIGGNSQENGGFQGRGLYFFGDTFLLKRKSVGMTVGAGLLLHGNNAAYGTSLSEAMCLNIGLGLKVSKARFSTGLGYAFDNDESGPIYFAGISWDIKEKHK